MLFTSLDFFVFLAIVLAGYALLPASRRWGWLLLASAVFYGWSSPRALVFLATTTAIAFAAAAALQREARPAMKRAVLFAALVLILGSLAAFKYLKLPVASPAGFSFYAFSAVSLVVDAYRGKLPGRVHAGETALYLAWFPKILAGPIERATSFLPQLRGGLHADPDRLVLGFQMVVWGLVKKVVIADSLAPLVDHAFGIAAYASPVELLLSVYFFAFQIYCDFSGYTDIAIGLSLLLGVQLGENFRRPYFSRSPAEFWSDRWHISLAHWFRDYLYIPLGGSRAGAWRHYLNVMIVFAASGLWHAGLGYGVGWTFLAWGVANGLYVWGSIASGPVWKRLGERLPRVSSHFAWNALRVFFTFHLIAITWVLFRARTLGDAWTIARKIATNLAHLPATLSHYPFSAEQIAGIVLIAALLVVEWLDERQPLFERLRALSPAWRTACGYVALALLVLAGHWQAREFVYMQF